jgi:hypothetical protein
VRALPGSGAETAQLLLILSGLLVAFWPVILITMA